MAYKAGETVTAARSSRYQNGVALSTDTPGSAVEQDWSTETLTFTNPGIEVDVTAQLTGRLVGSVNGTTGIVKVGISMDGGSTFTYGNAPQLNTTEASATYRAGVAASHFVSGTPTGAIVIKGRWTPSAITVSAQSGYITAQVIPR